MFFDEDEREAYSKTISLLLAEAAGSDLRAIVRSAVKAGLMWTCPTCRAALYLTAESCSADGARQEASRDR